MEVVDGLAGYGPEPAAGHRLVQVVDRRQHVVHQVPPHQAAAVGQAVAEAAGARHQQKMGGTQAAAGNDELTRAHLVLAPLGIEITRRLDAAGLVDDQFVHAAFRPEIEPARCQRARQSHGNRRSLGIHRAAEHDAHAAVGAAGAVPVGPAVDGEGNGKGRVAELADGAVEHAAAAARRMGWIGVALARMRRVMHRAARHAVGRLRLVVPGRHLDGVDRPIGQAGARRRSVLAQGLELVRPQAPGHGAPVHIAAADALPEHGEAPRHGGLAFALAQGFPEVRREPGAADDVRQFVVGHEVGLAQARPALQGHHRHAGAGEFVDHDAAAGAGTDHADIEQAAARSGHLTPP